MECLLPIQKHLYPFERFGDAMQWVLCNFQNLPSVAMSGYQWIAGLVKPSDYYVDYDYELNPTIGQDIKKQSRKEDL